MATAAKSAAAKTEKKPPAPKLDAAEKEKLAIAEANAAQAAEPDPDYDGDAINSAAYGPGF